MNDTELDQILDTWTAPPPPPSLRQNLRAAGRQFRAPRPKKHMFVAAILAAAALLLVVAQARPGSPPVRIPYTVDSEFIRYANDGSSSIEMYTTSYQVDGAEIIRSRSIPGHPFGTALRRTLDAALPLWSRLMARLTVDPETLERLRRRIPHTVGAVVGCDPSCLLLQHYFFARAVPGVDPGCMDGAVVDRETLLDYPTAAVRFPLGENQRMTWWTAPDLGCFALRITTEQKQPDGTFRLVREKRALRVNPRGAGS
jgi:hypothetical protein